MESDGAEPRLVPEPRLRRGAGRKVVYPLARAGNLEYDRVLFFTDAVFAIAITLLVVDLRVPTEAVIVHARHVLREDISSIIGFAISFGVIGIFWVGHHSIFRYINAFDRHLILLNLFFLGIIAFLPLIPLSGAIIDRTAPFGPAEEPEQAAG